MMFSLVINRLRGFPEASIKNGLREYATKYITLHALDKKYKPMNDYLYLTAGHGLGECCLTLIKNCKIVNSDTENYTVIFDNIYDNKLATLITFGTGKIHGCNLLREAFSPNY